jgi:L-fucose isomerase-like protein
MSAKAKALVIPFRFREGYPAEIVDAQVEAAKRLLAGLDLETTYTEDVVFPDDATFVNAKYNPEIFDFALLLIPTWIEPMLVIQAASAFLSKPVLVWGFGTFLHKGVRVDLGSIPGSGVVKGTLREMDVPHEYLYFLPGDEEQDRETRFRIERFANVARAASQLQKVRIGAVGYLFGTMSVGDVDITKVRRLLGPEMVEIDAYSIIRRMEAIDPTSPEYAATQSYIEQHLDRPFNGGHERIVRMTMALREFIDTHRLGALTVKCHFELSQQYGQTACIPLSVIGNTVVSNCEADIPALLTQLIIHHLSGSTVSYVDLHELSRKGLLVGSCGYAPSSMCMGGKAVCDFPDPNAGGLGGTFRGYITNKNYLREGTVTLARLLKDADGGFTMHMATGHAVGDIGRVCELDCPQYPFTEVELDCDLDSFAQNMGSHHYAIVYGDVTEDLKSFCRLKKIKVLQEKVSRSQRLHEVTI